jgi:hypothetical protein
MKKFSRENQYLVQESLDRSYSKSFFDMLSSNKAFWNVFLAVTFLLNSKPSDSAEVNSPELLCQKLVDNPATMIFNTSKQEVIGCKGGLVFARGKASTTAEKNKKWARNGIFPIYTKQINGFMSNADNLGEVYGKYTYIYDLEGANIIRWQGQKPIFGKEIKEDNIAMHIAGQKRQADKMFGVPQGSGKKWGLSGGCNNVDRRLTKAVVENNPEVVIVAEQKNLVKTVELAAEDPSAFEKVRITANHTLADQIQKFGLQEKEFSITLDSQNRPIYRSNK